MIIIECSMPFLFMAMFHSHSKTSFVVSHTAIEKCRIMFKRLMLTQQVILMTGDHPMTGKIVARQVGIISSESETKEEIAERFNISPESVTPG